LKQAASHLVMAMSKICILLLPLVLAIVSCRHKPEMDKEAAEKALKVFDSEVVGTIAGITQTDGWEAFSGLLKSDSKAVDSSSADNFISSVFLQMPFNFNKELTKDGQKVCVVQYYYKLNPDSSFYLRKAIYIKPLSLEIQCLYTPGKAEDTGHLILFISGRDTAWQILQARIRARIRTADKGKFEIEAIGAEVRFFDLSFSVNDGFIQMKAGSRKTWSDYFLNQSIEVSDYRSGHYIGRFESEKNERMKSNEIVFIFADGSKKPVSACFSFTGMLKSPD